MLCRIESQQYGIKTMLTDDIYNEIAKILIELPAADDTIVNIHEGTSREAVSPNQQEVIAYR